MAADGGSVIFVGEPLTTPPKRIAGSSKMATDNGSVIFGGEPLTTPPKRIVGSSKMAADSGSVIFGGEPLSEMGSAGADDTKKRLMLAMWLLMTIII